MRLDVGQCDNVKGTFLALEHDFAWREYSQCKRAVAGEGITSRFRHEVLSPMRSLASLYRRGFTQEKRDVGMGTGSG